MQPIWLSPSPDRGGGFVAFVHGVCLLDIGCGWGSLLIHAASEYGVRGVGLTVSSEQAALARERIAQAA